MGASIEREVVEQIADIDIELIADRNDAGKADARAAPPIPPCPRRWRRTAEISARLPGAGICAEKLALRLTPGIMIPRQFGPISRMPYFCAARSAASASEPGPCPSPALTMTAPAAPWRPASSIRPGMVRAGAVRTTSSGAESQFCDAADGRDTIDLVIARIDEAEFALELGFANIVENGAADRAMARTGPISATECGEADSSDDRWTSFSGTGRSGMPCEPRQMFSAMRPLRDRLTRNGLGAMTNRAWLANRGLRRDQWRT